MPSIIFTDRRILAFKCPDKGQIDYQDKKQKGLVLRIGYGGSKVWFARYRVRLANGAIKRRRKRIGSFPDMKLADARIEARKIVVEVDQGKDPVAEAKAALTGATVSDMAAVYVEQAKGRKRSWAKDESMLERDILPVIGEKAPAEVTRADIQKIINRMKARKVTTQVNRVFEVVRALFNWGVGPYLEISPVYGLRKPLREQPRDRSLSHAEIRDIWHLIEDGNVTADGKRVTMSKSVQLALKLLLITGQRVSEVSQAPKSEFDLEARVWSLPGRRTKNGVAHRVPLSDLAISVIKEAMREFEERKQHRKSLEGKTSEWLFPGWRGRRGYAEGDRPVGPTALNHGLSRVLEPSDIKDIRPHDFRSVVATEVASMNTPEAHISAILNHVRSGVTRRHYNSYSYDKEKREALDLWAERLLGILSNEEVAEVIPAKKGIDGDFKGLTDAFVDFEKRIF